MIRSCLLCIAFVAAAYGGEVNQNLIPAPYSEEPLVVNRDPAILIDGWAKIGESTSDSAYTNAYAQCLANLANGANFAVYIGSKTITSFEKIMADVQTIFADAQATYAETPQGYYVVFKRFSQNTEDNMPAITTHMAGLVFAFTAILPEAEDGL